MVFSRLVIFDVDGTLVDSQAHIVAAMTAAFDAVGKPVPARDEVLNIVGLSLPLAIQKLAVVDDPAVIEIMVDAYKAGFHKLRLAQGAAASPLYDGAEAAVAALAARDDTALAIATGKSRRGLDALMQDWAFADVFISDQCADDHPSKPHPSMALTCVADADVTPEQAVVIGDTTYDMEMARAARCHAIGVTWGYHGADALLAAGATQVIHRFDDLEDALDALWAKS